MLMTVNVNEHGTSTCDLSTMIAYSCVRTACAHLINMDFLVLHILNFIRSTIY